MKELTADFNKLSVRDIKEYVTGARLLKEQISQLLSNDNVSYMMHTDYGIALLMTDGGDIITWTRI